MPRQYNVDPEKDTRFKPGASGNPGGATSEQMAPRKEDIAMTDRVSNERIAELTAMQPGTPGPWVASNCPGDWGLGGAWYVTQPDSDIYDLTAQVCALEYQTPYCLGEKRSVLDRAKEVGTNARLIAAAPDAFDALRQTRADLAQAEATIAERDAENARLREALEWYENPAVYAPHPHGPAFDRRDLSFCARDAIKEQPK